MKTLGMTVPEFVCLFVCLRCLGLCSCAELSGLCILPARTTALLFNVAIHLF